MLPFEGSSQAELSRHLSNHVFRSQQFGKYISSVGYLFLENVQFNLNMKNAEKICQKAFCLLDHSISNDFVKLPLLR